MSEKHEVVTEAPDHVNLSTQAADFLRSEILCCRMRPGAAVSEAMITDRFNLGRAPVRAALARLSDEGLVKALPRRGWVVSTVTIRDIHEVFDLRLILEPEASRRAAGQPEDTVRLNALDAVCAQGYRPDEPESALAFLKANKAFHVAVAGFSGNDRLARQIDRLIDESTRMLVLGLSCRDRSGEMAHEHRLLIEALMAGEGNRAAEIMREQVAASRDMVLSALTSPSSPLPVFEAA